MENAMEALAASLSFIASELHWKTWALRYVEFTVKLTIKANKLNMKILKRIQR